MKTLDKVRISNNDKLNFLSSLVTMLNAGLSVLEIVGSLAEESQGNLKIFLDELYEDISQGHTISSTMSKFPRIFDKITVNVIRSAEESGTLESTIREVELSLEKSIKFNDKIKSAMLYPMVVTIVFFVIVIGILVFVIPKVTSVFITLNIDLPLPTKILLFISNILTQHTLILLASLLVLGAGTFLIYLKKRTWFINRLISLPFISKIVADIDLARFSHNLSLLLDAGIPIITSLDLTREVIIREDIRLAIEDTKEMVSSGKRMSEGFKKAKKLFPKLMVLIADAGEHSGSLSTSMEYISKHLEYQVEKRLFSAATLIEPVMLVIIGLVVGGMMLSIISPIYSLIGQIGPH
ncbi:hypothetical protein A3K29_02680 [Candidatus Collierbacteria bacterium RIFOXYB2_FULL_46_14]|uniref:Type II secretion system protein n=1 Tax=Candidatus Collierbacteria bacterium GW2011_GWA2_46_26 TaxID=1618381 RepID=A0A0G1PMI8_9BACT|nr:MAG: Type II secretion system protein [Candidatus Collierbacteria bacterium GW2011_GWC2_44_13]KKU33907.1 MAG: Type II secretion system protein [Candidatus Collierbacteria bacterium GW2011_GWA2_46_26]OGD73024.1 MAG: hypothetical protein A3K29_02680 [Candidatus Collierbacteria bacterium RIFOXYB2_FULL_46_14]OGD76066.1 MAG: hypothetical protein A3K43_02680 [Candidatus Collierbacteria bacterium RIFOXYA2_FULL_46_20]OGD77402.1 MAG: hypothetical protein A3K39_02680 [Candidatus Collierbacteria bacter